MPHSRRTMEHPRQSPATLGAMALAVGVLLLGGAIPAEAQLNATAHDDGWVLAAAHTPGREGSIWRTDVWVRFVSSVTDDTELTFYFNPTEQDNTLATGQVVTLNSGQEVYHFEDVVFDFLGDDGEDWLGAIHYVANANVQVWARIYNIDEDQTESFGQLVVGIPTSDMSPYTDPFDADRQQWMVAMQHTGDERFRVNVGVVNPTGVPTRYLVRMFDETNNNPPPGSSVSVEVDVPPFSMVQLGDPFADVNGGDWSNYQIRVETDTPDGGAFAYASVVDNATNDAFFVRGVKLLTPDAVAD